MGKRARYILLDALSNFKRSGWVGLASIATIGISFLIIGIFLILTLHLGAIVAKWREGFQVTLFLEDGITQEQMDLLKKRIMNEQAVKTLSSLSKEEALADFKEELKGQEGLLEGLGENPLPASFQLKILEEYQTPQALKQLAAFLGRLEGVEDVLYGQEWIERLEAIVKVLKVLGVSIGAVLAIGSLLIVSNTIRLAVYARAEEIEISRLMGATKTYIGTPFFLEGLLQGSLGASLAILLLFALQELVFLKLNLPPQVGTAGPIPPRTVVGMVGGGALIGAFGSLISVRRFLKL